MSTLSDASFPYDTVVDCDGRVKSVVKSWVHPTQGDLHLLLRDGDALNERRAVLVRNPVARAMDDAHPSPQARDDGSLANNMVARKVRAEWARSRRKLVYLAGPFGAITSEEREANTSRVCEVSELAVRCAMYAPVFIHSGVLSRAYGRDEVAPERAAGLACAHAIVDGIGRLGGELWLITRDDGTLSPGVASELKVYNESAPVGTHKVRRGTYNEWTRRLCRLIRARSRHA